MCALWSVYYKLGQQAVRFIVKQSDLLKHALKVKSTLLYCSLFSKALSKPLRKPTVTVLSSLNPLAWDSLLIYHTGKSGFY